MVDIGLLKGAFSVYTLILATTYFVFGSLLLGLRNARVKGINANLRSISYALDHYTHRTSWPNTGLLLSAQTNSQPKTVAHLFPRSFGNLLGSPVMGSGQLLRHLDKRPSRLHPRSLQQCVREL